MTPALFRQFRKQYSSSSLTTELLLVQEGHYVVRATANLESQPLATAMAAHPELEVAEDRAISRLLNLLGIQATLETASAAAPLELAPEGSNPPAPTFEPTASLTTTPEASSAPQPSPKDNGSASTADLGLGEAATDRSSNQPEPPSEPHEPDFDDPELELDLVEPPEDDRPIAEIPDEVASPTKVSATHLPESTETPAPVKLPASALAANALETLGTSSNSPVDLSDIIAQTDVEMSRLGWSNVQGREHLEKTYRKRSRQQLTDEELLEFLLYLESQPTPVR